MGRSHHPRQRRTPGAAAAALLLAAGAAAAALLLAAGALVVPASAHAGAPTVMPAGAPARASRAHVDVAATDPRFGVDEAFPQAATADALGVRWTRVPFIWDYVQPSGPTSYNPFVLSNHGSDAVIDSEIARGRTPVGLLLGTPAWARQNKAWGEASVPLNIDKDWNDPQNYWAAYCYKMAKHYAGKIDQWIIWNEVSIPTGKNGQAGQWTQWRGTPPQYARLLEVAYQAIHAANPTAKVVLYGDPYWYDHGAYLSNTLNLLAKADPTGKEHGYFDAANLHLYIGAPSFYWIISDLRQQLRAHGWSDKQMWVSETNVEPYDDPSHVVPVDQFRVTMDEQASFLVDAFATDIAAKVDRIEVYRMFDGKETTDGLAALGLVSNRVVDGQHVLRPVGRTFTFLVGLLKGAEGGTYTKGELYPDPYIGGKAGVFKVVTDKPGARITVLYNQLGAHPTYTAPYHTDPATPGVQYDAKDFIVLPLRDAQGVRYDRAATATYTLAAHATQATVYDKYGNAVTLTEGETKAINTHDVDPSGRPVPGLAPTTISLRHGVYTVQLRGGRTYSNPADPRIPTVGGDPVIIVEKTGR